MMVGMNIVMNIKQIRTLDQVGDFLLSVGSAELAPASKDGAYQWVAPEMSFLKLDAIAYRVSDNEAAAQ